ncbi:hypothetical protein [Parabacteroides pacaensis]|uniref:hypothetical protein n=1 Tax=Parabacteroides pacaensis TaxID=2086575 RepID=UPI000D113214|nr:hypothetical protein [Parabacteroides pacaensis]
MEVIKQKETSTFLCERAQNYIKYLRDNEGENYNRTNSLISNAMSVIVLMIEDVNDEDWRKQALYDSLITLSDFNYLLNALARTE